MNLYEEVEVPTNLSSEQLIAQQITEMSEEKRNELLALSPQQLEEQYPGFLSGERVHKCYTEQAFLPSSEFINASLYAGQEDFEGLQKYTYTHIGSLSVKLTDETPEKHTQTLAVPLDNIQKALGMVERFMEEDMRRTGEPGIAHIYRSILRTTEIIEHYNNLHNTHGANTKITPEIAEIMHLASILHDFVEDSIEEGTKNSQRGIVKAFYDNSPTDEKDNSGLYIRRALYRNRENRFLHAIESDIFLPIKGSNLKYLENALNALNSNNVDPRAIINHLLGRVYQEYSRIYLMDTDQDTLSGVPIFIKTGADRPDNLATYFFLQNKEGRLEAMPVNRLIRKYQENLTMFNNAELHMLNDGPKLFSSRDIFHLSGEEDESDIEQSPSNLHFFPSRWAKLGLLGLTPDQMYRIPAGGGLPQII